MGLNVCGENGKKSEDITKNRNTSRILYMNSISCKEESRRHTACMARLSDAADDGVHRNSAVREVFRGVLHKYMMYSLCRVTKFRRSVHKAMRNML